MTVSRLAYLAPLLLLACGGTTVDPGDGGADASIDGTPGQDSSLDAPTDAPAYLACMDDKGQLDGSLKTCQSSADCVMKQEETDCCGTILYVGVSKSSSAQFDACEKAWEAHFPGCGCASNVTKTEDGKATQIGLDGGAPQVHCTNFTSNGGICLTFTP